MKNLLLSFALASCTLAFAQVQAPQASPAATVVQTIGLTETSVVYSRPSVRGREVMGNLVPYGKIWRTGANKNTTIQFPDPVQVGGQTLAAGTYAIFTRPGASLWEVFFYTDSENSGIPKEWSADKVAATLEVEPQKKRNGRNVLDLVFQPYQQRCRVEPSLGKHETVYENISAYG